MGGDNAAPIFYFNASARYYMYDVSSFAQVSPHGMCGYSTAALIYKPLASTQKRIRIYVHTLSKSQCDQMLKIKSSPNLQNFTQKGSYISFYLNSKKFSK